jgi:hypothetical protein
MHNHMPNRDHVVALSALFGWVVPSEDELAAATNPCQWSKLFLLSIGPGRLLCLPMDSVNFLIWNVRGLNDKDRRENLQKVVEASRPSVVCLQVTKLAHIS